LQPCCPLIPGRFPLDVVFRIYDSCLANGIEAIFSFSIQLLRKNEEKLLKLKFDEMLKFLNMNLLDAYQIPGDEGSPKYRVDEFVHEAVSVNVTPFMLDSFRHEYEDLMVGRAPVIGNLGADDHSSGRLTRPRQLLRNCHILTGS
jgi:hypothetical protein